MKSVRRDITDVVIYISPYLETTKLLTGLYGSEWPQPGIDYNNIPARFDILTKVANGMLMFTDDNVTEIKNALR